MLSEKLTMMSLMVLMTSWVKALISSVVSNGSWARFSVSATKIPSADASDDDFDVSGFGMSANAVSSDDADVDDVKSKDSSTFLTSAIRRCAITTIRSFVPRSCISMI